MKIISTLLLIFATIKLHAQTIDSVTYKIAGKSYTGYYALPSMISSRTKTILIVHEWWGLNEYPKQRALKLAQEGNIAFCIDMYGTGIKADTPENAKKLSAPFYQDSKMAFNRFMAGYNQAIKIKGVDTSKIAAIGYCFGGSMVLNAAKMGAPIDLAVSFHGRLAGIPVEKNKLTAAVLICHGAEDKFVSVEEIATFKQQMAENEKDLTFIEYPNATHAFSNPKATSTGQKFAMPIEYNEAADLKSWEDFHKALRKKVY